MCKSKKAKLNTPEGKAMCESRYGKCATCKRCGDGRFCQLCDNKSKYLFDWKAYAKENGFFPYAEAC